MIAFLVLYTAVVSALCAVAGVWAERAALLARWSARWAWAAAIAASCVLPSAAAWRPRTPSDGGATLGALVELLAALGNGGAPDTARSGAAATRSGTVLGATDAWTALDRPLAIAWAVLAGVALIRLVVRAVRTRRAIDAQVRDPEARRYAVRRATAIVTATLGPAVIGGWRATLVLPRWTWEDLDRGRRHLVFAHEAEHLRAGDPRLLTGATILAALAPWNPAAWWMLARLRDAVELDCDRRVLARAGRRAAAPIAAYGTLLLDVAARHAAASPGRPRLAPALAESTRTTLERRIHQMTAPRPIRARARFALLSLGTLACVAAACELPRPTGPRAATTVPLASLTPGGASPQAPGLTADVVRSAVGARTSAELDTPIGRTRRLSIVEHSGQPLRVALGVRGGSLTGDGQLRLPGGSRASVRVRTFAPGALGTDSVAVSWVRVGTPLVPPSHDAAVSEPPRIAVHGEGQPLATLDSVLVVIDGRVAGRGQRGLKGIAPDSILSMDVLKGTAATARYGEAGRAGVIVITRKSSAR